MPKKAVGGGGRKAKVVKPGPPLQALKAVGTGPHKRTPQSLFDAAAEEQLFEPETIVGERTKKQTGGTMQTQYEVKWKGWETEQA